MRVNQVTSRSVWLMTAILLLAAFLRLYRLEQVPNGLLTDEAMRGYDAYSILHTGADSFGEPFPIFPRGFDDYTPGLYVYLTVPFVALLDLSALSTRLAAAMIGIVTVAAAYQVLRHALGQMAALAGALLLAVSPWHIFASRSGTEWDLLALGSTLTIAVAYRGLSRPRWLMAAGVVAGLALYSYAPIKIFLPILLLGFAVFYRRELMQQRKAALVALAFFIILAIPVYAFSFTARGMSRLQVVSVAKDNTLSAAVPTLIGNYFAYYSPRFLFEPSYRARKTQPPVAVERLQSVGLHYWFELPLLVLGLVTLLRSRHRPAWFLLYWLVVAPIGINLHLNSPWATLWLTSLPTLHAFAGAGFAWLVIMLRSVRADSTRRWLTWPMSAVIAVLIGAATWQISVMLNDLFNQFPLYGAQAWSYGPGPAIKAMQAVEHQYDSVIYSAQDLPSAIDLLFYTRYDPTRRHADLAANPQQIWQNINGYHVGPVKTQLGQPGCHLIVTTVADGDQIQREAPLLVTLERFDYEPGRPAWGLYVYPTPSTVVEREVLFGDKIALRSFAPVAPVQPEQFRPGQAICLVLQWQALTNLTTDYAVFMHLVGPENPATQSSIWAQGDSIPAYGARPTSTWVADDTIEDPHVFATPPNLPAGHYEIRVGLYDPTTGQRLPAQWSDGQTGDHAVLMEFDTSP